MCEINCGDVGMDLSMALKRGNNIFSVISVLKLVENITKDPKPIMSKV